ISRGWGREQEEAGSVSRLVGMSRRLLHGAAVASGALAMAAATAGASPAVPAGAQAGCEQLRAMERVFPTASTIGLDGRTAGDEPRYGIQSGRERVESGMSRTAGDQPRSSSP